eukprot:CAMPEP_0184724004 /NCGR_PEP_ID=MMETSP0314-20130426/26709_1 /TAXON_ID=38298 /ORGANISM="Rhodella maculata, Strain CCMP 736" /LENGTH=171 /DNA_ID=CAMNT_0027188915 /DNA_START=280 /DNA_END=791 /DNA_ORIENTATION=+
MQHRPRRNRLRPLVDVRVSVQVIPEQARAAMLRMHANLVRAPRVQPHEHEGQASAVATDRSQSAENTESRPAAPRLHLVARKNGHSRPDDGMSTDGLVDDRVQSQARQSLCKVCALVRGAAGAVSVPAGISRAYREVDFLDGPGRELLDQFPMRLVFPRNQKNSGGALIQA